MPRLVNRTLVLLLCLLAPLPGIGALTAPSRIVSVTLMTDEFLADLVEPERILAYSRSVDDPVLSNAVDAAKAVKGRAWLNLELLVGLNPDVILAADWSDADAVAFLRQKGYRVVVVKTPRSWAQVKAAIADLGDQLSASDRARALLGRLAAQEAQLAKGREGLVSPTVLEYNSFGSSMGTGTLWDDVLGLAGVTNAARGLATDGYGYAALSREMLVTLDPDWLVLPTPEAFGAYGQSGVPDQWRSDPLFQSLRAVKGGRVISLSEALKTSTSHAVLGAALVIQRAATSKPR